MEGDLKDSPVHVQPVLMRTCNVNFRCEKRQVLPGQSQYIKLLMSHLAMILKITIINPKYLDILIFMVISQIF